MKTISHRSLLFLTSLILFISVAWSTFIYLPEGAKKCFLEEVPKNTLVLIRFQATLVQEERAPPVEQKQNVGIKISVEDPNQGSKQRVFGLEGRYAFTAQLPGEHRICLQTNTSNWFGSNTEYELELSIETGAGAVDYNELAKIESLSGIEVSVRRLNDIVNEIIAEQLYQKKREAEFRDTSEATNGRVLWWSIVQILLLLGSAFWQIRHLKNFFHKKKVV